MSKSLVFTSNQGTKYEVDEYVINKCETFKNLSEDSPDVEGEEREVLKIEADDDSIQIMLDYIKQYKEWEDSGVKIPEEDIENSFHVFEKDREFLSKYTNPEIIKVGGLNGFGSFIDYPRFRTICEKESARRIEKLSTEEIRELTGEVDDYTEEERQQVIKQNKFLFE